MSVRVVLTFFLSLSLSGLVWAAKGKSHKTFVSSVSTQQVKLLRSIDRKYQKQHGIHVQLEKKVISETLGTEKTSKGEAWIHKGKMKLEIHHPLASKIVADGKNLWMVSPPIKEFKGSKTQVIKASLNSSRAKSQGLIQLLTQGGLLKYFKVVGVKPEGKDILYFLQPENQSVEFKRAQVTVNLASKEIRSLFYWDRMNNETQYFFNKTAFNQKISKKQFVYSPPSDADLVVF